jgi:hypothetical protein
MTDQARLQRLQGVRTSASVCAFDLSQGYTDTARAWLENFCGNAYHKPEEMDEVHRLAEAALFHLRVGNPFPAREFFDKVIATADRELMRPIDPNAWGLGDG